MKLNDFKIWEIFTSFCRKLHKKDSTNSKVRSNQSTDRLVFRKVCQFLNLCFSKACCSYNRCKAIFQGKTGIFISNSRHGEIYPNICIKANQISFIREDRNTIHFFFCRKRVKQGSQGQFIISLNHFNRS